MNSESASGKQIVFGPFTLDLGEGELRRNGLRLRLQPKTRRLLLMLASRPGQVLTREEIRKNLWGSETYVDVEHALNFCVCQLRAVLRDPVSRPRYIETLPKRGYRFIAHVYRREQEHAVPQTGASTLLRLERTVAVLPYKISSDSQQSIADGMTDCLVATLSKIPGLRVIPAGSVMRFQGTMPLVHQLAFTLDANWVVDGRILIAGKQIRISSQLVDAPLGSILWSEQHEDHLRNVLSLQSRSSHRLAEAVSSRMLAPVTPTHKKPLLTR